MDGIEEDPEAELDLDEIYQPEAQHALAGKKTFAAWHHPRKQYVRIHQWCSEVQKLIPKLGLGAGDPFRYLTLPGNELLDVRAIESVCEKAGVKLRYLGFNSVGPDTPDQAELALSQSEVRSLAGIDEFSDVLEDRLEAIANERSPAFARTQKSGPFHAINLDLCDCIAFREVGHSKGSPLEATGRLLELQLSTTTPWLLFITTKAQPSLIGDFARDGFMRALDANSKASDAFRAKLADTLSADLEALDTALAAAWDQQDGRFLKLFCMGLGKWLLGILSRAAPPRELKLISSCFYQSGPDGPDMLSLAFYCAGSQQAVQDAYSILPAASNPPPPTEVEAALGLGEKIAELFDLDAHLTNDPALTEKLIAQKGRLLATVRYAADEYESWARERVGLPLQSPGSVSGNVSSLTS